MTSSESIYDSATVQSPAIREFLELWNYRDLLQLLIINSIKTRYKRSILGVAWSLLNPLLSTLILTIAFSQLFKFEIKNYPVYLLSGIVFWNFFSQTTTSGMGTLIWGSNLFKRIYIPRTIFTVSVLGNGIINLFLYLIPLLIVIIVIGHPISLSILFLPVSMLLLAMFTFGISLVLSTIAVFFVDVVDIYGVILSAWYFATPIIYPMSVIPEPYLPLIQLNPLTTFIILFRDPIFFGQIPSLQVILVSFGLASFALFVGWWIFTSKVDELAYRL